MDKPALHICPACGKSTGAEVIYGMPDAEAWELADAGRLVIGGCMREGDNPDVVCTACGHEWNLLN